MCQSVGPLRRVLVLGRANCSCGGVRKCWVGRERVPALVSVHAWWWNQAKDDLVSWWAGNSKEAYSSGLANLATALGN
jgi:hypothetical protein